MTERARREYAAVMQRRYRAASRQERSGLLDEYCRVTGNHRKAAIRRLGASPRAPARRAGRPPRYTRALLPVLEPVWRASDYLSGKLLHPVLPVLLTALQAHHGLVVPPALAATLRAASPATLDRLLRPQRHRRPAAPRRQGGAPNPLRAQIPVRTWSEWKGEPPGALQGDLVLHCGASTAGFYLATLVAIDVATSWLELHPLWGLHHQRVTGGIQAVAHRLPFALRHWHSDNGSEFVNRCLFGWCQRHAVAFTRGRPYRKNDQAWVEQRNGLIVRRLVGYHRFASRAAHAVLLRLYQLVRLQHNFFRPVRKLVAKRRVGSRVIKRYDAAQTPYQRVLATGLLPAAQQERLAQQFQTLDPIALAREIEQTLDVLWALADTRLRRALETAHG